MKLVVYLLIGFAVVVSLILYGSLRKKRSQLSPMMSMQSANTQSQPVESHDSYLTPADFNIGMIQEKVYKTSNQCNPNVLYPIQGLGPEYGSKMSDECPCTQNLKSPDYSKKIAYFK